MNLSRSEWTSYPIWPGYASAPLVWKKTSIVKQVPSKSTSKIQSEYLQNPDTFQKVAICFTPQLLKQCLHPVPIFNLWCCAWEETFASQRGKASRRDGQIPCIEGRAVSVSHAHRRIWWRWRRGWMKNWEENWSKESFVKQELMWLQGLYQSRLYQLYMISKL